MYNLIYLVGARGVAKHCGGGRNSKRHRAAVLRGAPGAETRLVRDAAAPWHRAGREWHALPFMPVTLETSHGAKFWLKLEAPLNTAGGGSTARGIARLSWAALPVLKHGWCASLHDAAAPWHRARRGRHALACMSVTLEVSHGAKFCLKLLAPRNTAGGAQQQRLSCAGLAVLQHGRACVMQPRHSTVPKRGCTHCRACR